ncbi:MAG: hypothetical protein Q9160_006433 [Pyrenula sp. 1 TL-2023]
MPGIEIRDPMWTLSLHDRPHLKAHKQLPKRRDLSLPSAKLSPPRLHHQKQIVSRAIFSQHSQPPTTPPPKSSPAAPLTPPPNGPSNSLENDVSTSPSVDTAIPIRKSPRSGLNTPIDKHKNLPTPDITPPRKKVGLQRPSFVTQPSLSSRAASFTTAREELSSDADTTRSSSPTNYHDDDSLLQSTSRTNDAVEQDSTQGSTVHDLTPTHHPGKTDYFEDRPRNTSEKLISVSSARPLQQAQPSPTLQNGGLRELGPAASLRRPTEMEPTRSPQVSPKPSPALLLGSSRKTLSHRDRSLRDRLKQAENLPPRPSTEDFASNIGWTLPPESPKSFDEKVDSWRLSGISTTSTVEAIVVDNPPTNRKPPLRHRGKNASLRSASSPVPGTNRSSWNSNVSSDSPRRLVHKTGRISNTHRWSQNTDTSRSVTLSSITARSEPETIPVVVIPQRKSSLKSSTSGSRRHSVHSSNEGRPITAPEHASGSLEPSYRRKRTLSDSVTSGRSSSRGRKDRHFPPTVPVRTSSLSAPTSRNNSRSSSMNSESLRQQRQAAEADVRRTLARMESESPSIQSRNTFLPIQSHTDHQRGGEIEGNTGPTPPPIALTPFSQPSVLSVSPGPVEISEATAVNLFAHNNHSLQIIERGVQGEARVLPRLRLSTKEADSVGSEPSTPERKTNPLILVDSPLRNPREPPKPPAFKIIPPTPAGVSPVEESDKQLGQRPTTSDGRRAMARRLGSLRRAFSTRRYSESFIPSLTRGLNLKNARNRREEENFDDNLHPFWRPRGFWDDFSDSESEEYPDEDIIVHNSLGIPQKRIIFDGPISLVRRISNPLYRNKDIRPRMSVIKRASYGSLSRGGWLPGRRIYTVPGLNYRFQMLRLSEMQEKLRYARVQREDERREKRRQEIRKKIGPNVVAKGDSRFL